MIINKRLISAASFSPNSIHSPNAWVGHLPFAAWLIQISPPKIFVELGTHTGNSYFSFCQSVADTSLSTKCYAIDTWEGDEHAGDYGDEIFQKVNSHNRDCYANFSTLLRMRFDDALTFFANESIGLLHIDGLHTYEAVRHDFETWLPKLAPGAIVLFHDTNVHERNFGVWKLWEELQVDYPNNIEFKHSHGLGLLQLNNAPIEKRCSWLEPKSQDKEVLIDYFDALGSHQLARYEIIELKQAVADRDARISYLEQAVADRDARISYLEQAVADRDAQIQLMLSSTSWRLTAPIRALRKIILKIR